MKTVRVTCSIQQGSIGYKKIKQLESVLTSTYQTHFGSEYKLLFFWIDLPLGQAYLAGQLSNASTAQIPVQDGLPPAQRHPFMSEVCAKWQHITGCDKNEIILVSPDMSHFQQFHQAMERRFDPAAVKKSRLTMLLRFVKGYFKKGYLNTSVNL